MSDTFGIIFDLDGVLVDSAAPHLASWRGLAEENGMAVSDQEVAATFGRQNRDIIPHLFGPVDDVRMQSLADRKEELYRDLIRSDPPIVAGALELVHSLAASGVLLAIGSSAPRANIDLCVEAMGLLDCISVIVSGDDVRRGKPDPEVFSLACMRLGLPPARCLVVEDAPVGIAAAKAAGAAAVAVLMHHPAEAFQDADFIAARVANLSVDGLVGVIRDRLDVRPG